MKRFKDLVSGDKIYIVSFNRNDRRADYRSATFSNFIYENLGVDDRKLFFKENDESETSVNGNESHKFRSMSSTSYIGYFSDRDALDIFLKKEIEDLYEFRDTLEKIYEKAWNTNTGDITKSEKKNNDRFKNTETDYKKGDILYNVSFEESLMFDGNSTLYASDGYAINIEDIFKIRLADKSEKIQFMNLCRNTIMDSKESRKSELVILALSECGYRWDPILADIFHDT